MNDSLVCKDDSGDCSDSATSDTLQEFGTSSRPEELRVSHSDMEEVKAYRRMKVPPMFCDSEGIVVMLSLHKLLVISAKWHKYESICFPQRNMFILLLTCDTLLFTFLSSSRQWPHASCVER